MSRDFFINGESLVRVRGRADTGIASIQQLGLCEGPIVCSPSFIHDDMMVDAWGEMPADVQFMGATMDIRMTLIQFDKTILNICVALSAGGVPAEGQVARAGQRMGNNMARFAAPQVNPATGYNAGNNYIGLNINSPVYGLPWRFIYTYLTQKPFEFPLGAKRSGVILNWRAICYVQDPYQGGLGSYGQTLYDHLTDD